MDSQTGALPQSICTPRRESGCICPYVGCTGVSQDMGLGTRNITQQQRYVCVYIHIHIYQCAYVCSLSRVRLGEPMDCSTPSFSVHGISQAWILEWVVFPTPGDLPHLGIELASPALEGRFFTTEPPGKPIYQCRACKIHITKIFRV